MYLNPRLSKEIETLERLHKSGLLSETEYTFARAVLENRKGEL